MRRLRILAPGWSVGWHTGRRFATQFKALARHHDVTVVTTSDFDADGVRTVCIPMEAGLDNLKRMLDHARKVVMEAPDFDVLYVRSGGPLRQLLDVMTKNIADKPAVMQVGGDTIITRRFYPDKWSFDMLQMNALDIASLNNFDLLIPLTTRLRDALLRVVLDSSRVAAPSPITVDMELFKPSPPPGDLTIGYSGRISPEKGGWFLRSLMEATPGICYRVAGVIQLDGYSFPENAHYVGILPHNEMPGFYRRVNAVLLPSLTEGLPNAILEAYASGRPIICTPEAHPPELPVFGWEVPLEPERWTKLIRGLDPEDCRRLGMKAREWLTREWPTLDEFGERLAGLITRAYERWSQKR